jgi:succinylglutamate desuccinylase
MSAIAAAVDTSRAAMKVTVVGGTHGNEYTGVWCIKSLGKRLSSESPNQANANFPSLDIKTLLANPIAHLQNKRFVDQDLNRQFSYKALIESDSNCLEARRAREINQLLGPKQFDDDENKKNDNVVIDLHTTTTNMGTTLIVGEGDPLMTQCAAYIIEKCGEDDVCVLMHTHESQKTRPHLSSIANHALSIEVGPVPQGILKHEIVEKTQLALEAALEFLEKHKADSKSLKTELKTYFPNGQVPCIRSAPAKRAGEMSSKIAWPCDPSNENFPSWMVHKRVQDQDFQEIKTGDPLFVDLDGNVIEYDGSHGSPVILMFINEGGYYYTSSGTGISVARRDRYSLETGKLIE